MGKRRSGHARECEPHTDTQNKRAREYNARKQTQSLKGPGGTAQQWVRDDNTQRAEMETHPYHTFGLPD